jgi:outer membrane protein
MNRSFFFRAILYAAFIIFPSRAVIGQEGNPRRVSADEAVRLASESNPGLKAAIFGKERARASVEAENGAYPFVLQLDGSLNHSSTPSLSADSVTSRKSDTTSLGAELKKSFPTGTTASFRMDGDRQTYDSPSQVTGVNTAAGPTYGMGAELSVTQPILRGAGKRVGEAGLRQARIEEKAAKSREERIASELVRDVLFAYWMLWYADRAVGIETAARDLAKTQLDEMAARVEHGEAASVDTLAYQTRLESLEEAVVTAQANRRAQGIELKRLVGSREGDAFWFPDDKETPPTPDLTGEVGAAVETAIERSPEVMELTYEVALAEESEKIAGEDLRPALGIVGTLSARILGNKAIDPAFEQLSGDAYSAYLSLVYELPLSDTRKKALRASASLSTQIARENLASTRDLIAAQVRTAVDKLTSSKKILELVERTADVAEKQAAAERERFDLGAAVYLQVKEAEESARQAKLRLEQARIDAAKAGIDLAHLTGELLGQINPR